MPTPLPKRGVTKVCLVSPLKDLGAVALAIALLVVSIGLLNVQSGRPSVGSQAGLIFVMATPDTRDQLMISSPQ